MGCVLYECNKQITTSNRDKIMPDGGEQDFVNMCGFKVKKQNWEKFQSMKKRPEGLPPLIKRAEVASDTLAVMFFEFDISVNAQLQVRLVGFLETEHFDYVRSASWHKGVLKVILQPPKRNYDPESRKNARHDIPILLSQKLVGISG